MLCNNSKTCCDIDATITINSLFNAGSYQFIIQSPDLIILITAYENLFNFLIGLVNAGCSCQDSKQRILNSLNINYYYYFF